MEKIMKGFDVLSKEERGRAVEDIIAYFATERDEEIGVVAAGELLDVFLQNVGAQVYNKAIDDVRTLLKKQADETDYLLSILRK